MENKNLNDPEIDRTIHLLEYELDSRHSEEKRHGWTTWAIAVAIVSSLWLMFSVIEQTDSFSWRNVLYIFILLNLSLDLICLLIGSLPSTISKDSGDEIRFFRLDISLTKIFVLLLLRILLLMILIFQLSPILTALIKFSCWSFLVCSFILVEFILIIAIIYKIPFPVGAKPETIGKWIFRIFQIIWFSLGFVAITGLVKIIYVKVLVPSIPEWRIGFILFGLLILLLILFTSKGKSILLEQLNDIRRKLSLGQIELNSAKKQADLLLYGLTVDNILQPEINNHINLFNKFHNIYEKQEPLVVIIEKFIDTEEKWNKDDDKAVHTALNSLFEINEEASSIYKMIFKNQVKVERRLAFISGMSIDIAPAIEKFINEIYQANKDLLNVVNNFTERYGRLKEKSGKRVKALSKQLAEQEHS